MMSSTAAVSATVRLTTPLEDRPSRPLGRSAPGCGLGLRPTRPQHDDGMRMDSPPSLAGDRGHARGDRGRAAASDPPGVWSAFHGFRVTAQGRRSRGEGHGAELASLSAATGTNPASSNRWTTSSRPATGSLDAPFEFVAGGPAGHVVQVLDPDRHAVEGAQFVGRGGGHGVGGPAGRFPLFPGSRRR